MARTRTAQLIGEVARRRRRGELSADQAQALTADLREAQEVDLYRAALDVAAAQPVKLRLLGLQPDVANLLSVLDQVTTLTDVSDPFPARGGLVRVYATAFRRGPLTGGIK